jgi:hypothetical protein
MLAKQPTLIRSLIRIERKRTLSCPGDVFVATGQEVNGSEAIAQTILHNHHTVVDVRQALRIKKIRQVADILKCKVGEHLDEGDIIAETGGFIKRVVRAPMNGIVTTITAGKVILEVQGRREQLNAGYSGVVTEVYHHSGALIEGHGALVQGVWGNNQSDSGELIQLGDSASAAIDPHFLSVELRGVILFSGTLQSAEVLKTISELSIRGLILGTMSSALLPLALGLKIPLMLTDGFGDIGMNLAAYQILNTNVNREIDLVANSADELSGTKPEAFIPLSAKGEETNDILSLKIGRKVRILCHPYQGQIGKILQIQPGKIKLPNGIFAGSASIRLMDNKQITVPLENLDLLE